MVKHNELTREIVDWFFSLKNNTMFKDLDRARKICEMRLNGSSFKEIGAALGIYPSYANEYCVKRILTSWRRHQYLLKKAQKEG